MPKLVRRRKLMGEINVVPYIDVMLVLLVIFMITAPLLKEGVKVDLPEAAARPIDPAFLAKHDPLVLTIDSGGRFYINFGQNQDKPAPILVKADTTVPYGTVVRAMVMLQQAGAAKVGFLTDPPARPAGGAR